MAKIKVDMSQVEERVMVPEGDHIVKVSKITVETSENTGGKYLKWELTVGTGEAKGSKLWHITSLKPKALFNLRNTIMACGVEVPKSVMNIDTDDFIGKILGVTVAYEEYEGKNRPKVADLWKAVKNSETGKWTRANASAKKAAAAVEEEDEEEAPFDTGATGKAADEEIDDIEI